MGLLDRFFGSNSRQVVDNTPVEAASDSEQPNSAHAMLANVGRFGMFAAAFALPIVAVIGAGLALYVLFTSICHLGTSALVVNPDTAKLVAASVTVTLLLLFVVDAALALTGKRRTLLIAGLFTLAWLALAVLMAILDTAITVSQIKIDNTLLLIGTFIYSALPALPIIPAIALGASAAHEKPDQYPTLAAAGGSMLLSVLKVLLTVAMFAFEAFFGISLGLNPIAAIFAATLNATAFALALGNTDAARHEGDRSGVNTWGAISTFYAVLMFVIAIEAILKLSSGASGVLAAMYAPAWLETLALWAFVSSIGLSALLLALTFWRKSRRGLPQAGDSGIGLADRIRIVRAGADDVRDALRGPTRAALPAGMALNAKDAAKIVAGVNSPDPEIEPAKPKRSEAGVPYDTTGELVLTPEQDAELRNGMTKATPLDDAAAVVRAEAQARKARRAGGSPPQSKSGGAG